MTVTLTTRPTDDPVWATDEANNTEPITAKKELGWEVDEEPASAYFNWWQNNVYLWQQWLEGAIDDLNSGKLDIDGDTMTGKLILSTSGMDAKGTITFGPGISVCVLDISSGTCSITGDYKPSADNTYDLGEAGTRIAEVHARAVIAYESDDSPSTDTELVTLGQKKATLACAMSDAAGTLSTRHHNVATCVRTTTGTYEFTLDRAVHPDSVPIPTVTGGADNTACADVTGAGTKVVVYTRQAGTLANLACGFVLVGSPASLI